MTNHISVVMAVHDRRENVERALYAWQLQDCKDFHVVVADDGSTEDIKGLCKKYAKVMELYYRRVGEKPQGCAVALNAGVNTVHGRTTHIWFTDGDLVFNTQAMTHAYQDLVAYPDRVITGRYDWMPPMKITLSDLKYRFNRFVNCQLPRMGLDTNAEKRQDHRVKLAHPGTNWFDHNLLDNCKPVLGASVIIPVKAWWDVEGWDEHIPGANANDCDFGWCLTDKGYKLLTCESIIGYHQWHPRDAAFLARYKESMPYIFRKHGQPVPKEYQQYDLGN